MNKLKQYRQRTKTTGTKIISRLSKKKNQEEKTTTVLIKEGYTEIEYQQTRDVKLKKRAIRITKKKNNKGLRRTIPIKNQGKELTGSDGNTQ